MKHMPMVPGPASSPADQASEWTQTSAYQRGKQNGSKEASSASVLASALNQIQEEIQGRSNFKDFEEKRVKSSQ